MAIQVSGFFSKIGIVLVMQHFKYLTAKLSVWVLLIRFTMQCAGTCKPKIIMPGWICVATII
jgi:hypothetical protein